ncbi:hypothetical protein K474DRAFT_1663415 [Panus rudis PR-1116 ss-1]|nr:hypothetical protein K474DRAFT_1663415 [Panus rudis PR-1116 ss-1]
MSNRTTQRTKRVTVEPVPHYPDIVLALNLMGTTPPRFHWLLWVADEDQTGERPKGKKFHAVENTNAAASDAPWSFDDSEFTLPTSRSVAAAAIIGRLKDKTRDDLRRVLSRIPMTIPPVDAAREPVFSCRVWVREALRTMHREGFIYCPDVDALEQEMWGYGRAAAQAVEKETFELAKLVQAVHSRTL